MECSSFAEASQHVVSDSNGNSLHFKKLKNIQSIIKKQKTMSNYRNTRANQLVVIITFLAIQ